MGGLGGLAGSSFRLELHEPVRIAASLRVSVESEISMAALIAVRSIIAGFYSSAGLTASTLRRSIPIAARARLTRVFRVLAVIPKAWAASLVENPAISRS